MSKKLTTFSIILILIFAIATPGLSAASPGSDYASPELIDPEAHAAEDSEETDGKVNDPYDLTGRVIILDPGHGIGSTNIFEGYDEQVAMLDLAHRIKPLLKARGATVRMTRYTGENVLLPVRAAMVNIWALEAILEARLKEEVENGAIPEGLTDLAEIGCKELSAYITEIKDLIAIMQKIIEDPHEYGTIYMNTPFNPKRGIHPDLQRILELQNHPVIADQFLFISLHSNATPRPIDTNINGAKAFHISNEHRNTRNYFTGFSHSAQSRQFGVILLSYTETIGFQNLGPKIGNFFVIREHNVPAVLTENGFHTNARDRAMLMDTEFMDKLAAAYLYAITEYFSSISHMDGVVS